MTEREEDAGQPGEPDNETGLDLAEAEQALTASDSEAEQALTASDRRRRSSLLKSLRRGILKDQTTYSVTALLTESLRASFHGQGITNQGGPPNVVGEFLVALHHYVTSFGGELFMHTINFSTSVYVEMQPVVPPAVREEVERLSAEKEHPLQGADLDDLIPDSVVAVYAATRVLELPSQEGLRQARRFGAKTAATYVSLARTVDEENGSLEILGAPGREESVEFGRERAALVVELSKQKRELDPIPLTVTGRLTRTDSEEKMFRIVLDRARMPPEIDGRKRYIDGEYTAAAHRQVQAGSLWDNQVVAKVRAYPVEDQTGAKPRLARFRFTSVKPVTGR